MAMDVVEHDDHFAVKADLPGMDKNDINVEVDGKVLTIKVSWNLALCGNGSRQSGSFHSASMLTPISPTFTCRWTRRRRKKRKVPKKARKALNGTVTNAVPRSSNAPSDFPTNATWIKSRLVMRTGF
jgi:hypothetical protein